MRKKIPNKPQRGLLSKEVLEGMKMLHKHLQRGGQKTGWREGAGISMENQHNGN